MSELQAWDRRRVELRIAAGSTHPLVRSALDDLQVTVMLAHAEEVEAEVANQAWLLEALTKGMTNYPALVTQICGLTRDALKGNDTNALAALRNFIDVSIL